MILEVINSYLSDYVLTFILIGLGIYFSFKTRFVQIRYFSQGWKKIFAKNKSDNKYSLSAFQTLSTSVAAQVGTGNIIGICGAIIIGGPGVIFWMWVISFFSMATIYAEAVLAQKTRIVHKDGRIEGGPVCYINFALPNRVGKFLSKFFAVAIILALGFIGTMVQSCSITKTFANAFSVNQMFVSIIISILAGAIFIGGAKRIAMVTEKIVPFMALLYLFGGCAVLILSWRDIGKVFVVIFKSAFLPNSVLGGSFLSALKITLSQGVKKGLFSNEAGMGSTPHVHALAETKNPNEQGIIAMFGVFFDTIILTITSFVVVVAFYTKGVPEVSLNQTNMAQLAFSKFFGNELGNIFVALCLIFFAFSTIISWNLFGKINFAYLFGDKFTWIYYTVAIFFVLLGGYVSNNFVWNLADLFNQFMVLPNAIALILLSKVVVKISNK